jgi:tetratricopeptide (TPR) repeat protein
MSNLASLLVAQGKLTEAEPLHRQALEARRGLLGNDHHDTLNYINSFAEILEAQEKLTEAESLYRQALEARRRLFGDDHPDTIVLINNLGSLLCGLELPRVGPNNFTLPLCRFFLSSVDPLRTALLILLTGERRNGWTQMSRMDPTVPVHAAGTRRHR